MASIAYLETGSAARGKRDPAREKRLYEFAANPNVPAKLRSLAIQMLPVDARHRAIENSVSGFPNSSDRALSLEAVRLLVARSTPSALERLSDIAGDESLPVQTEPTRQPDFSQRRPLRRFAEPAVPAETTRRLAAGKPAGSSDALGMTTSSRDPGRTTWTPGIDWSAPAEIRTRAGASSFASTCVNCHAHSGRGASTGPDLTTLSGQMSRKRLLESILQPSKEVGPLYVPYRVLTVDGHVLTGLETR